jgi:hypothetical protein
MGAFPNHRATTAQHGTRADWVSHARARFARRRTEKPAKWSNLKPHRDLTRVRPLQLR